MPHEKHGTGADIGNYISIGLLQAKDFKKRKAIFSRFMLIHIGSTKDGRKSRYFMPRKALISKKFLSSNKKTPNF